MNRNPGYDYLQGIVEGLFLFDLSQAEELTLTDRTDIDNVLYEQKLKLSGLIEDKDAGMNFGKIVGADYLLSGSYVFLGKDLLINLKAVNVVTGKPLLFLLEGIQKIQYMNLRSRFYLHLQGRLNQ